jgi:ATP-dependent DNA helicase RecQ
LVGNQPEYISLLTPEQILKQYWGYDAFRHSQKEIVMAILDGKDCLALLPTGGGKSVCFQVPAVMMEGVCLVVSPLIALMEDQVMHLKKRGIRAEAIHSGMSRSEIDILLDNCVYGDVKLLYVSPERLLTEIFIERFKRMKVSFVAIDEAHCISQWGYDFRPPYLKIAELRDEKPAISFLALTASATAEVKQDIAEKLQLKSPAIFQRSFARPNISFAVRHTENKERKLLDVLQKIPGTSIVYVRSRKSTRDLAQWLNRQNILATYYHAGLDFNERKKKQEDWQHNRVRVMVATNAFGMGIDKDDVRSVVHMDLPQDLESYYQEAGRAGRDGKKSYAVIIYHDSDVSNLESKVNQSQPTLEYLKKIYQGLANYFQLAEGAGQFENFDFDLTDFCNRFNFRAGNAYPAVKKLEEAGLIQLNESFYSPSKLHITVDKLRLYEFQVANAKFDPIIQIILRLYGAESLSSFVVISEMQIAKALKIVDRDVMALLQQLHQLKILNYLPASHKPQLSFLTQRIDANKIPIDNQWLEKRRALVLSKMKAMIDYATQGHQCRQWIMLDYFDEKNYGTCGVCDVCLSKKKKENLAELKDYREQILYLLKRKPMTVDELESEVKPNDHDLMMEVVREMVDDGEIRYDEFWVLRIDKK